MNKYAATVGLESTAGFVNFAFEFKKNEVIVTVQSAWTRDMIRKHGKRVITRDQYNEIVQDTAYDSTLEFARAAALFGIAICGNEDEDAQDRD